MPQGALSFSSLLNRLKLIGVTVVHSPPAPTGSVWLFGKKEPSFPFTKSPIYPIKARKPEEPIPGPMIKKILKHLGLEQTDQTVFWDIQEDDQASAQSAK